MTNFARVIDNVAVDVSPDPENHFHPDIAAEFVAVPAEVQPGWVRTGDKWAAPAPVVPPDPVPEPVYVSPVNFKLLFTAPERVAIKASTDAIVQDFFSLVEDPRLTRVDLTLQSVKDAVHYLAAQGLIGAGRADEILSGQLK